MKLRHVSYSVKGPDGTRIPKKSEKLYGVFVDFRGVLRRIPLDSNPKAAKQLADKIDTLNSLAATSSPPPPDLARWIESAPPLIVKSLAAWGIVSSERLAAGRALKEHVTDWGTGLRARGNTEAHVALQVGRVNNVLDAAKILFWSGLNASRVLAVLGDRRLDHKEKRGMSAQTFNHHVQALKQFCLWMVRDGRAAESPLAHLRKIDVKSDRRHDRRALEVDEALRLFAAAEDGPVRHAIPGAARAILYEMAIVTGLRFRELGSLTRASFKLEGDDPCVIIAAKAAKNRREATIPLPTQSAERLKTHLANVMPAAPALRVPTRGHAAKMLKADLDEARARWIQEAGKDPTERERREQSDFLRYENTRGEFVDFHALRHTRGVWLFQHHNVSPREAVELMRVSSLSLVDRYSRSFKMTRSVADLGPDLSGRPTKPEQKATGTDGRGSATGATSADESPTPPATAPDGS